jgi:hypothetical protein
MKTRRHNFTLASLITLLQLGTLFEPSALAADSNQPTNTHPAGSSGAFECSLRQFIKLAPADPALCALLSKHRIALQYEIKDLGLDCYLGFEAGKVVGAFGKSARLSELVFVSDSRTMDKVLRGDNGKADMEVDVNLDLLRKLSLRKDLKQIRAALARVYAEACQAAAKPATLLAQQEAR